MTTTTTGTGYISDTIAVGATGGDGSVTITGGTYALQEIVGSSDASSGTVSIRDGATVAIYSGPLGSYRGINGAVAPGGTSSISVTGAGTNLSIAGEGGARFQVAVEGTGTLAIEQGASVAARFVETARVATGTITVDGAGSLLLISGDNGNFLAEDGVSASNEGGFLRIGREDGSVGIVTVSNGGTLRVESASGEGRDTATLQLGQSTDSRGELNVTGADSLVEIVQRGPDSGYAAGASLQLGRAGQGIVRVSDGAALRVLGDDADILMGQGQSGLANSGAENLLEISGGGSVLVDSQGFGEAGTYRGSLVSVGLAAGSVARVSVTGAGSSLTVRSDADNPGDYGTARLRVGELGAGTIEIGDGGTVSAANLSLGIAALVSDGAGGTRQVNSGYVAADEILEAGSGAIAITGGGSLTVTAPSQTPYTGIRAGRTSGTTATITVDGEGSSLTSQGGAGWLQIGDFGTASLSLTNGGQAYAFFVGIGRSNGGEGTLSVEGAGSRLLVSNAYGSFLGEYSGEAGLLRAGRDAGSQGRITVTDGGLIEVINDPATNNDFPALYLGSTTGAVGVLEITGEGSTVRVAMSGASDDALTLGQTNGASVQIGVGGEGIATVSQGGELLVSGADSTLFVGGASLNDESRGLTGTGFLAIESGGVVTLEGTNAVTTVATDAGNSGEILVTGVGSALVAGTLLLIGEGYDTDTDSVTGAGGVATLTIAGGGSVRAGETVVGARGLLDADGVLEGDLTVGGRLEVLTDGIGALSLDGTLLFRDGAVLALDTAGAEADSLAVVGDADFNLDGIAVELPASARLPAGADTIVFATVEGALLSEGAVRIGSGSALLELVAADGALFLRAGTAVSTAQAQTVALLFEAAFDRDGEIGTDGLNFWIDRREAGATERQLSQAFLNSPEFRARYGDPATLSDEDFVAALYRNTLDRDGNEAGIAFWANRLDDPGVTRADVLLAFAKSAENVAGSPLVETLTEIEPGVWDFV